MDRYESNRIPNWMMCQLYQCTRVPSISSGARLIGWHKNLIKARLPHLQERSMARASNTYCTGYRRGHWIVHVSLFLHSLKECHYLLCGAQKKNKISTGPFIWQEQVWGWIWKGNSCLSSCTSGHALRIVCGLYACTLSAPHTWTIRHDEKILKAA